MRKEIQQIEQRLKAMKTKTRANIRQLQNMLADSEQKESEVLSRVGETNLITSN